MTGQDLASRRQPRVVVVGSINMDLVFRSQRLPRPGETVSGHSLRQIPGGKGANQAVGAARLGAEVTIIGRVGDDSFGASLFDALLSEGIDVTHVRLTETSSGVAVIGVDDGGQNCITVISGANGCVCPDDVRAAEAAFIDADVLLLQFEIPLGTVLTAMDLARRHRLKVIVDPAPAISEVPAEIYEANVLCPNESEAEVLSGIRIQSPADAMVAARVIHDKGGALSLVTMGDQGVAVCGGPKLCHFMPAFRVSAVDTTASGDAFAAGLSVAVANGMESLDAIRFASAAGALAATRHGAQPSMPTRNEVEALLADSVPDQQ